MCQFREISGLDNLKDELTKHESTKKPIFLLFCGSKDSQGESWCPDCVTAEPVVDNLAHKLLANSNAVFLHVSVGPREEWKNMSNPFRTTEGLKLTAVPTLMQWKKPNRLVEEQCLNSKLVEMLFSDGLED